MTNHFAAFLLPEVFDVNLDDLEAKYLQFQQEFHPDKSSSADISKSIEINEAYKILSDDFLRACHLLQLKDVDILNDEKATKVDFATLTHVLELQEEIAEIEDRGELDVLRKKINEEFKGLILQGVKSCEIGEIEAAAQSLIKAKYLKKSLADLKIRKREI